MRLLICAGGTGGGVYPALAVLQALGNHSHDVLWVGNQAGMDADLVQRAGVSFRGIPAAGVHGVGLASLPGNLVKLMQGLLAARKVIREFKPDAMLFTGGYVAVPVALAGKGIPSLLYVPDIEPGLALKVLSHLASQIALTTEESRAFFSGKKDLIITGYPLRSELTRWSRSEAREKFSINPDLPTVLVFGGSKGARSINQALLPILPALLEHCQVIHISGTLGWSQVESARSTLDRDHAGRYFPYPYLHDDMGAALAAADLVVSRAGASTLGEFPFFGLPAVLVPYPYAWRYQKVNADYLINRGAARLLEDQNLREQLLPTLINLLSQPEQLETMRAAMSGLSHPQAANQLAKIFVQLAESRSQEKGVSA